MAKKIFLIAIFSLLILLIVFQKKVLQSTSELAFKKYVEHCWGETLVYAKATLEGTRLVIYKPRFEGKEDFFAEKITVHVDPQFYPFTLNVQVLLDKPQWEMNPARPRYVKWMHSDLDCAHSWINIHSKFELSDGLIHWKWNGHGDRLLWVNLQCESDNTQGCAKLQFDKTHSNGEIDISFRESAEGIYQTNVLFRDVCEQDCQFLQAILAHKWPEARQFEIQTAQINGELAFGYCEEGCKSIDLNHFVLSDFALKVIPLKSKIAFKEIGADGSIDFSLSEMWDSLNAKLYLKDGKLTIDRSSESILTLSDLNTNLLIQKGIIQRSPINFNLSGFKGNVEIEGGSAQDFLTVHLEGSPTDLSLLFPESIQSFLRTYFPHDICSVEAKIKRFWKKVEMEGKIKIQGPDSDFKHFDLVNFGCNLDIAMNGDHVSYNPQGWFNAKLIPLEKYIAPFLFPTAVLELSGIGDFKGTFDRNTINILYDPRGMKLENEHLVMEYNDDSHHHFPANYTFDLRTGSHWGALPLQNATYYDKKNGLLFSDIKGVVEFKDQSLRIDPVELFCKDIFFGGSLDLDYSSPAPGVFSVAFNVPQVRGRFSQVQQLLSHLDHRAILGKMPLEGDLESKNHGLTMKLDFFPEGFNCTAFIQGSLNHGSLPLKENLALESLDIDFDYHHGDEILTLRDVQGVLLAGKSSQVVEYGIDAQKVLFKGITGKEIELDIQIKDGVSPLMRIVGSSYADESGQIHWEIDKVFSHFANIHPTHLECVTQDSDITVFNLDIEFELNSFLHDIHRLITSGLFPTGHHLQGLGLFQDCSGSFKANINYDQADDSIKYEINGENLIWKNQKYHSLLFKGKKQDKKWMIDHCQLDEFSLFAELHHDNDQWKIDFLGLNKGDAWQVGLDGFFYPEPCQLKAKIKLLEINLEKMSSFDALCHKVNLNAFQGLLRGVGDMHLAFLSQPPWIQIEGTIQADLHNMKWNGYHFKPAHAVKVSLNKEQILNIEHLNIGLLDENDEHAHFTVNEIKYALPEKDLCALQLDFNIPTSRLRSFSNWLQSSFPGILQDSSKELLIGFKVGDDFSGKVYSEKQGGVCKTRIVFGDGIYKIKQRKWDLKNLNIEIQQDRIGFSASSQIEEGKFSLVGEALWPSFSSCEMKLFETGLPSLEPLKMTWREKDNQQVVLDSVEGQLFGVHALLKYLALEENPASWMALKGDVAINPQRFTTLVGPSLRKKIEELQLEGLYHFNGTWWMNSQWGRALEDVLYFQGKLESHAWDIKGFALDSLQADLQYVPGHLDVTNFTIEDQSGLLISPTMTLIKNTAADTWNLSVPQTQVKNFTPSLLREPEAPTSSNFKTLLVKQVELNNFTGLLDDIQTWRGEGNLAFVNPSRKNAHPHPLFAVPAEVILRLGLNPHVLNPVAGKIFFKVLGNRFYLTRFKDVYSEGRGSKFSLVESGTPSWIDFDGNISVQIKMKQYNLMFKLAELFTVSIEGPIKKPKYMLYKHGKEH